MKRTHILVSSLMIALAAHVLHAQEPGWEVSVGVGVAGEHVYPGSDAYYVAPVPSLNASYTRGSVSYSLSILEGFGITYLNSNWGLMAGLNVNAGAMRDSEEYTVLGVGVEHNDRTKALLAGSPDLDTPLAATATLAYASPIGLFGASLEVHPTSVEPNQTAQQDETRTGLLYSLIYMAGGKATERLSLSGLLSVDFMDETYADTWYAVDQPTGSLSAFDADDGLRSSMVAVEVEYRLTERVTLSAVGASTFLLGDARESPYTVESVHRSVVTQLLYHF